jgi:nucleoside-diphosphate-sugar epimerase
MTGNKIILADLKQIAEAKLNWSAFSGKTILISGANGFLPAYMVETLLFLNHKQIIKDVRVLALVRNLDKAKSRFKDYLNNENLEFIVQDVCDPINIERKIDFIIHAASQASPKYYGTDPVGTLSANTLGTINMIKLAHANTVESFLYFSSSEVYGILDESKIPTNEMDFGYVDPTNIRSCYAESKRMGENICVSWFYQYGIPAKIVRPFHTYGPCLNLDDGRVYADFISDIVNNRDIIMKSDGSAVRSFCYLSDATIAFFLVLLNGKNGEAYNVGNPQCETSIIDLAEILVKLFPQKKLKVVKSEIQVTGYIKSVVNRSCPDSAKIQKLGWKPGIDIREGFIRTVKSYTDIKD